MLNYCPICNAKVRSASSTDHDLIAIDCFLCRNYRIEAECAKILRQHYLSFNHETVKGKDAFDHNLKLLRDYIKRTHHAILTTKVLEEMLLLEKSN